MFPIAFRGNFNTVLKPFVLIFPLYVMRALIIPFFSLVGQVLVVANTSFQHALHLNKTPFVLNRASNPEILPKPFE